MTNMHEIFNLCSVTNYSASGINTGIHLQLIASTTIVNSVFKEIANFFKINIFV